MLISNCFLPFKGRSGGVLPLLLLLFLSACTGKQEKLSTTSPLWEDKEEGPYDLHEIQASGTIIAGTLSGPDTYYEYHGKGMGPQFRLAEAFAQSIGVVLQMEISPDTASLLQKLKEGEIDFIALEMPTWQTREGESLLKEAIGEWWQPERVQQILTKTDDATVTVRRRMRPVMQDAAHGIISAYDDLFRRYSSTAGWDWRLLAAQCYQESGFDPQAVSSMGAMGLMQLMPATADAMGVPTDKRFDPEQNIAAAARYIRRVSLSFSDIRNGDERIRFTLAAYNGGVGHVQDAQTLARKAGRNHHVWQEVAPYILHLSEPRYYRDPDVKNGYMRGSETVNYVDAIRNRWRGYRGVKSPVSSASAPQKARNERHKRKFQAHWVASE